MGKKKTIDGIKPRRKKAEAEIERAAERKVEENRERNEWDENDERNKKDEENKKNEIEAANEDFLTPIKAFDYDEETGELMKASEEEEAEPRRKKEKTKKKGKKKKSKIRKVLVWVLGILFVLLAAAIAVVAIWGNDLLAKITGGRGSIMDIIVETYEPLKADANGRTNVLIFGTSGFDMDGTEYGGGVHDGADLTDSIMVISFNQETGNAAMISLPRDLKVDAGCNYTGKVNEIYYCNNLEGTDEEAGAQALTEAVGEVLGLEIPYYAHINWGSLRQIVDALGGITVTLDESVEDYWYTGAVYDAGVPYTLNGEQAIALARARHGTMNGDFSRGAFQQKIILGIKDKITSSNLSLANLLELAGALGDNLRTNFEVSEVRSAAHLAMTLDWAGITQVSFLEPEPLLTDGIIGEISYVYPRAGVADYSEIQAYIQEVLTDDPVKKEKAAILVLNATETAGLAGAEQAELEAAGFTDVAVDNYATGATGYTIYMFSEKPATKAALEEKYGVTATTEAPEDVPRGYDFVVILGA